MNFTSKHIFVSIFQQLLQSIAEHKPLVDKLNKTGEALIKLTNEEEGIKVQEIMDQDNARYNALKVELRQRQQALEKALQVKPIFCYFTVVVTVVE